VGNAGCGVEPYAPPPSTLTRGHDRPASGWMFGASSQLELFCIFSAEGFSWVWGENVDTAGRDPHGLGYMVQRLTFCVQGLGCRVQGYLAHKKHRPFLGPPYGPRHSPTVGS